MYDALGTLLDYTFRFVTDSWQLLGLSACLLLLLRSGAEDHLRVPFRRLLDALDRAPLVSAAVLSLALILAVFSVRGEPLPESHDDYSQLLLADTIRHGRLANPVHRHAAHFETMLTLQRPTYSSHFPLATGFVMAGAWIVTGMPIVGIWLATAAAAVAITWAARGWLPRSWSVLAGALAAAHPTLLAWNSSYCGGSIPLLGGALLLGSVARMRRHPTWQMATLAALAMVILANSRPFEGLVLTAAAAVVLSIHAPRAWSGILRNSAAAVLITGAGAAVIAAHNRAVTGDPLRLPHAEHDAQYNPVRNFFWETPRPPVTQPNLEMAMVYRTVYLSNDRLRQLPGGWWRALGQKADVLRWSVFPRPLRDSWLGRGVVLLYLPLVFLPGMRRRKWRMALILLVALFLFAPLVTVFWTSAHYVSPAGAAVAILYVLCLREMAMRSRVATLLLLVVAAVASVEWIAAEMQRPPNQVELQRQQIARALAEREGTHLVMVPPEITACVHNAADIDAARVVWARELTPEKNAALRQYFTGRRVWRLERAEPGTLRVRSE